MPFAHRAGSLPSDLSDYTLLPVFDVSNNRLSGSFPTGGCLVLPQHTVQRPQQPLSHSLCQCGTVIEAGRAASFALTACKLQASKVQGMVPHHCRAPCFAPLLSSQPCCLLWCAPGVGLPPNITVFDVSYNPKLGGALPSPLPPSLVSLDTNGTRVSVPQRR